MLSALSSLPLVARILPRYQPVPVSETTTAQNNNITPAPNLQWSKLEGPVQETLLREMKTMYWNGVKRELTNILLTLHAWQQPEFAETTLLDEKDDFIHGFDTFIDQVSQSSREFVDRYERKVEGWKWPVDVEWKEGLREMGMDFDADLKSQRVKGDVRNFLAERKRYNILERRARMLLQSAGFLDIDKLMEHRQPETAATLWKRPVAPQLIYVKDESSYMPSFAPLHCSQCEQMIRSCMFKQTSQKPKNNQKANLENIPIIICETCYREHHYGNPSFLKSYKHCVLQSVIGKNESQEICRCSSVVHINRDGSYRTLFPVDPKDKHRESNSMSCGLLGLGTVVAEKKFEGMMSVHEKRVQLGDLKREVKWQRGGERKLKRYRGGKVEEKTEMDEDGESGLLEDNQDIPFFLEKFPNSYPFGNVHMALRVGPLIIENGVEHVGGALVTSRDPPNLHVPQNPDRDIEYSISISGDTERSLYSQIRANRKPKRYKAIMKQVVGGAFSGLSNATLEEQIVKTLIRESRHDFDLLPTDEELLLRSTNRLLARVRQLLEPKVDVYLQSIASRLTDPTTLLEWNFKTNNCQIFCDSLMDKEMFGSLVAPSSSKTDDPLYLLSFITHPSPSHNITSFTKPKNKYSVPLGHIEEYLTTLHHGEPSPSDLIDNLQEYWHDWGAFSHPIYKYNHVFPWDCTEAYGRYPATCNDCNIAKHVWAFPYDSFSISALHLTRDRWLYPPLDPEDPHGLTDAEWMQNRLTILLAQDVLLTAAVAMAKCPSFHSATSWLNQNPNPKLERLKLGGIHRAQPFSHSFEKGEFHRYFIAEWASYNREEQIKRYEILRDERMRKLELETVPESFYRSGYGAVGEAVGCGACMAIVAMCGGGCGTGTCAVACGAANGGGGGDGGGCGGGCGGCGGCGG